MSNNICLPVSLGEAIDKLTILDIKLNKIKDNRRLDVEREYILLYEELKNFIIEFSDLYQTMKKVNLLIWNMMDLLRDEDLDNNSYLRICKECIEYNDIRFRIKNKINYISNSNLKEQKSYKITKLLIQINSDIENINNFLKPITYYSFFYDEIIIIHNKHSEFIKKFKHEPTINVFDSMPNYDLTKKFEFLENEYKKDKIFEIFNLTENKLNIILHT